MAECPNAPEECNERQTYSCDEKNKKNKVKTSSPLCCLLANPNNRSMDPLEPQPSAVRNQLKGVGCSNLFLHSGWWCIAQKVAEITRKHKYK
jgi:hypothetical protein